MRFYKAVITIACAFVVPCFSDASLAGSGDAFKDAPVEAITPGRLPSVIPQLWKAKIPKQKLPQAVIMAMNNAKADALNRLVRRVKAEQIAKEVSVGDFLRVSDNPGVDMTMFFRGVNVLGARLRGDRLVCEVEMKTTLRTTIACFKSWADNHVRGKNIDLNLLQRYVETIHRDSVREIGTAVVDPEVVSADYCEKQKIVAGVVVDPPLWISERIVVVGSVKVETGLSDKSVARQKAFGRAEVQARKILSERLYALKIDGEKTLKEFAASSSGTDRMLEQYCASAKEVKADRRIRKGEAEFSVSLQLKPVWNMIVRYRLNAKGFEE
jgi:hypothetical protein